MKPRALYNEYDKFAAEWLRNLIAAGLIPDGDVNECSVVDLRSSDIKGYTQVHLFAGIGIWPYALRRAGWPDDKPILTGSCPCPPFSSAGKAKACPECGGTNPVPHVGRTGVFVCCSCDHEWVADERHLWPEMWRLIRDIRPEHVIGEQVASADGRTWLASVRASLEILGYAPWGVDGSAAVVGSPHIRQRIWFSAERGYVGLADADNARLEGREFSAERTGERLAGQGSVAGGMANPHSGEFGGQPEFRGIERDREDAGRQEGGRGVAPCGDDCDMAESPDIGHEWTWASRNGRSRFEDGRDGGWLADTARDGRGEERQDGGRIGARNREEGRPAGSDAGGTTDGLADTVMLGCEPLSGDSGIRGTDAEQGTAAKQFGADSAQDRLANTNGGNASAERQQRSGEHGFQSQGDLFGGPGDIGIGHNGGPIMEGADPTNGFWRNPDWLFCRDGKWRPIESESTALAYGLPRGMGSMHPELRQLAEMAGLDGKSLAGAKRYRIGSLKGYGNAIVSEAAMAFIQAYMDYLKDAERW